MGAGPQFGNKDAGSAVEPCPLAKKADKPHWVEIELLGQDGSPVPLEEYRVNLPNGDVARGYLDENGRARIENIESAGTCKIQFPALDKEAWSPA